MGANLIFTCSNCDAQFAKWTGRCLECGQWGTVEKSKISQPIKKNKNNANQYAPVKIVDLDKITTKNATRVKTKIDELDRAMGGGLVPGSLLLLGGEPGIGKSTLALQIATIIPNTIYISGEESVEQIKLRANRLNIKANTLKLGNETGVENIIATVKKHKDNKLLIIDSIQTIRSDEAAGEAGSLNQIKACTIKLMTVAKSSGLTIIIIGQVTKEGAVAGPKSLEHLVDTVLYLEGDRWHQFRILRTVKNRFGSTDEIGIFAMEENGLQAVNNPSQAFISNRPEDVSGSTVTCLIEGSRPLLVEIQALVSKTNFGYPQRKTAGFSLNRLQVLIAVLSKRTGLPLDSYDVFLNVAGGLKANEPAADLAVILAIASALKNKTIPNNLVSFGEVGLGGEVRNVRQSKKRLQEIKKLGFDLAVTSNLSTKEKITGLKIAPIKNVKELVKKIIR